MSADWALKVRVWARQDEATELEGAPSAVSLTSPSSAPPLLPSTATPSPAPLRVSFEVDVHHPVRLPLPDDGRPHDVRVKPAGVGDAEGVPGGVVRSERRGGVLRRISITPAGILAAAILRWGARRTGGGTRGAYDEGASASWSLQSELTGYLGRASARAEESRKKPSRSWAEEENSTGRGTSGPVENLLNPCKSKA